MIKFLKRTWPVLATLTAFAIAYVSIKPFLRNWLKETTTSYIRSIDQVEIDIESINWQLLPPRLEIEGVSIAEKNKIPKIEISKISASPDFIAILFGDIYLSIIEAEELRVNVNLDLYESSNPDPRLPIKEVFQLLNRIPVRRLALIKSSAEIMSSKLKQTIELKNINALAVNRKKNLSLWLETSESKLVDMNKNEYPFSTQLEATLNQKDLDIDKLKLNIFNSSISLKSKIFDIENVMTAPKGSLKVQGVADLELVYQALKENFKMPKLTGKVQISGDLDLENIFSNSKSLSVSTKDFGFDQYFLGNIDFETQFKKDGIHIPEINLTSEAFLGKLKNVNINIKKSPLSIRIDGNPSVDFLDVHQLLKQIGLKDIPVENFISAELKCGGEIYPDFGINCKGGATGEAFEVRSGDQRSDVILRLKEFEAIGEVVINSKQVSYTTDLKIANNVGKSDGVISYQNGFKINFSTESLNFADVDNLADLKIEGIVSIKGSTEGNSHAATFDLDLQTKNYAWFEDFGIGSPDGKMSYKDGILKFSGVQGLLNQSPYNLDLSLNLKKGLISGNADIPRLEMTDGLKSLERKFQLPIQLSGTGPVSIDFEGPLSLGKLSYSIDTRMASLNIAGEKFDELVLKAHSVEGNMNIDEAYLVKNKALVRMIGSSTPKGDINWKIVGDNFLLEELQNVVSLGADVTGILDFSMSLEGHILSPDSKFYARLNNMTVADQEFPVSEVSIEFGKNSISGSTSLVGQRLKSEFQIPLNPESPFRLSVFARDWNYATLFSLIGGGGLLQDYRAQVSGNLDLRSERGGFFKASGQGEVTGFLLQRGDLALKNIGPMKLNMTNGQLRLDNFVVRGDDSEFQIKAPNFSADNFQLRVSGDTQLRIFQILVPFLEDLGGRGQFQVDIDGNLSKPIVLGSASIKNGFAKLKGFPHALERIESQVNFSQNKIILSKITGQLAGGSVTGEGDVSLSGYQNFPTNIRAKLHNVSLNVPDKVKTNGDADLLFSGKWFPFVLSGTYKVNSGIFEKEFTEEGGIASIRQSAYLPKILLQSSFEPVLLDINVILDNPLAVKNKMVDGKVNGNIVVKGAPTRPNLQGRITVEKNSKLIVRDRIFEVLSATVDLDDPNEINPTLFATARTRVSEYDINLTVQGKTKDPILRMSSVPPLPEKDIVSLLALGITSQKLEQKVESKQQEQSTYAEIGTAILSNTPLFKSIQQDLGVQVQISSQYNNANNYSVRKITVSRQLTDKVNASATRLTGQQNSSEVKLQYSLDENVSAVGTFESREASEDGSTTDASRQNQSIFGFDLDFRKEFR